MPKMATPRIGHRDQRLSRNWETMLVKVGRQDESLQGRGDRIRIVFYTKPGCHLCEEARDVLREFEGRIPLRIEEIDILTDFDLYQKYKHKIPVGLVADSELFVGRIDRDEFVRQLSLIQNRRK